MLSLLWVVLSSALSLGQLLVLLQSDWIVHGPLSQGLFAVCYQEPARDCQLRLSPFAVLILGLNVLGALLLLVSTVFVAPFVCFSSRARPVDLGSNAQMLAVVLTGISVIAVPFDLGDVLCSPNQLLQSTHCRIGWPYALSCIFALVAMCCPVLAKLIADQRKSYSFMHRKEWFL
uniref:G_PROTEIN_RECEP_F1_2 domain-containing protein n=1 Tax=Steinernema glaseri TaxID=37863 RepID=A0A1I7Z855_9BILA